MAGAQVKERGAHVLVVAVALLMLVVRRLDDGWCMQRVTLSEKVAEILNTLGEAGGESERNQDRKSSHQPTRTKLRTNRQTGSFTGPGPGEGWAVTCHLPACSRSDL